MGNVKGVWQDDDIIIADFEGADWQGWTVEGEAFADGPANGRYKEWNQPEVIGFLGKGFANSFYNNLYSSGILCSPPFRIERPYINFLIGGTFHPTDLCLALVVGGVDVQVAWAKNPDSYSRRVHWTDKLRWQTFHVSNLMEKNAHLEIRDKSFDGYILVDHIVQSKVHAATPLPLWDISAWKPRKWESQVDKKYLMIPVCSDAPLQNIAIEIDGEEVLAFSINIAMNKVDGYLPVYDLSGSSGATVALRFHAFTESRACEMIHLADAAPPDDPTHPAFHIQPRLGFLNDPNGLVYYDGEYHLFHQYSIYNMRAAFWGHRMSTDLVHWEERPLAIFPDKFGSMHSGSAVIDAENTAGFQTGEEKVIAAISTGSKGMGGTRKIQCQVLSYSNDRGRTFTKYAGNPIIGPERGKIMKTDNNRDPKVFWYSPSDSSSEGYWVMALFEGNGVSFFNSPDLKNWEYRSHIKGFHECPDIFRLPLDGDAERRIWVFFGGSGRYLLGDFDGKTFTPSIPEPIRLSYGNAFYASQTFNSMPAEDDRRILVAWMNPQLSFPVELTLRSTSDGPRVHIAPVREVERLHAGRIELDPCRLENEKKLIEEISGELFDVQVEIVVGDAETMGVVFRGIPITYDVQKQELICADRRGPLSLQDGKLQMQLITDRNSIEIFAGDGVLYMPMYIPMVRAGKTFEVFSKGGSAQLETLIANNLKL